MPIHDVQRTCFLQLFYRSHLIGAILFVVFGILHWNGTFMTLSTGLAVWAIDVAYRWFQTQHLVTLTVDKAAKDDVISMCIQLQVGLLLMFPAGNVLCKCLQQAMPTYRICHWHRNSGVRYSDLMGYINHSHVHALQTLKYT
jgi:hypothetical protein